MAEYAGPNSLSQARDFSYTSDEEDEENSPQSAPPLSQQSRRRTTFNNRAIAGRGDCDSEIMGPVAEVTARKPRGRPPGSKNKAKAPVVRTREIDSALKSAIIEISGGSDIIEMVVQFARRRQLDVSIISGSGSVSSVTLRHPSSHAPLMTLHGPFNILSLTGTFLGSSPSSYTSSSASCSFGISLAGQQGKVFGGIVGGKVIAAGSVVLVVATFVNSLLHRLPGELEETEDPTKPRVGGGETEGRSTTSVSMSAHGVASPTPLNSHAPPEVLTWAHASRSPQPY